MSTNIEIEAKHLLTKNNYQQLLASFPIKQQLTQTNYYFDTPDGALKEQKISFRLRCYQTTAELTIKIPLKGAKHDLQQTTENNELIDLAIAKQLLMQANSGQKIIWPSLTKQTLAAIPNLEIANLCLQASSATKRTIVLGPKNCELTLDQTTFLDQYIDYELEIEHNNAELINEVFAILQNRFNLQNVPSPLSKIARAYLHKK